jgi:hypothetical protein
VSVNGDQPRLRITDMTDRELCAIIAGLGQDWVSSAEVALEIWPRRGGDQSARLSVLRRFSYLRSQAGLIEKHDKERDRWRLSEAGKQFLAAKLKATVETALSRASDYELSEAMAGIGNRYREMSHDAAWLLRREWQHRSGR